MAGKETLSDRKKQILKAIVDAHIEGGDPIGSNAIIQNQHLTCSPATVRNEMAELEKLGYLEKPHTSAGRVPSELGYRFYVDSLIEHYAMTTNEIMQINALLKAKMGELDQILMAASNLASNMTNYTGIAIKPRTNAATISKVEAIYLEPTHYILILVDNDGNVKSKHIRLAKETTQDAVLKLSTIMTKCLNHLSMDSISLPLLMSMENAMGDDAWLVDTAVKTVYSIMKELDGGDLNISGLNHLLQYPEYSDTMKLQELMGTLEQKDEILDLVSKNNKQDINVLIGSESEVKVMDNSSLVIKPIIKDGKTLGAIGVLGPRRMDYAKVLATLEGLSGNINTIIQSKDSDGGDIRGKEGNE